MLFLLLLNWIYPTRTTKNLNIASMGYLRFEKALMTNLEEALPRELLRTNRSGAYSCSTIVDCNTRKYHGLLVVPIPEIDDENHVLLSSLDVTVIQHGAEFNLGLHKYQGNNYSPKGHKYIREFDCDKVPTTVYRVGGVILKKEVVFQHYEDRILIRYTLEDAHSATTLRFRPFLAFRSVRQFTHENSVASRDYQSVDNGIKTCMYAGYPDLYMQFSKKNEFIFQPDWYRGVEYPKEQERGYASNEDLYVPGYFEMDIKKGESIVFAASTSSIRTSSLKSLFDKEVDERAPRDNFFHCLVNAAHQFHNRTKKDERYILAGYPWFKCRARDTFIALPGLTLAIEEQDYFELVMKTAEKGLREFMKGKPVSVKIYEMEQPDVPLWAIWSVQQYAKEAGEEKCFNMYGKLVRDIVEYIEKGGHPNLTLEENGLLRTEESINIGTTPEHYLLKYENNFSVEYQYHIPKANYPKDFFTSIGFSYFCSGEEYNNGVKKTVKAIPQPCLTIMSSQMVQPMSAFICSSRVTS